MRKIFKTKLFSRWAKKAGLTNEALVGAVAEMSAGLVDVDLGGGVVKKRVAQPGQGKRGSTRTLLATNFNDRWFFVFGFEKNERVNITKKELVALKLLSGDLLALNDAQLAEALVAKKLFEVSYEQTEN